MPSCKVRQSAGEANTGISDIIKAFHNDYPDVIELNVGGEHFVTTIETLARCKGSTLANMFSGDPDFMPKDKDGRFYIETDGKAFSHILNYLRCDQMPPSDIAEVVYKLALVLGLEELSSAMERLPPILQKVCRETTRSNIPGYQRFMSSFLEWITEDCRGNMIGNSTFCLSLFKFDNDLNAVPKLCETFDKKHICFGKYGGAKNKLSADLYFGCWGSVVDVDEKTMMDFMVSDVSERGYTVSEYGDINGGCEYRCLVDSVWTQCGRKLFYFTVQWWTLPKYHKR